MTMPQRDETILRRSTSYGGRVEEIKRLGAPLEYAVMHIRLRRRRQVARSSVATEPRSGRKRPCDEAEAARLRAAREANDRAGLAAYGLKPDTPEPEIVDPSSNSPRETSPGSLFPWLS